MSWRRKSGFRVLACVVVACLLLFGCSKKEEDVRAPKKAPPAKTQKVVKPSEDTEMSPESAGEPGDLGAGEADLGDIPDQGMKCIEHQYVLPAGDEETLYFGQAYPLDKPEATTYALVDKQAIFEKAGITASVTGVVYSVKTVSYPIWVLDGRAMFAAVRKNPKYKPSMEWGDIPYVIPVRSRQGDIKIHWRKDGYGLIEEVKGMDDPKKIGELSSEALTDLINPGAFQPILQFNVAELGETYSLQAVQQTMQADVKIQTLDVVVSLPDTIEGSNTGCFEETAYFKPVGIDAKPFGILIQTYTGPKAVAGQAYFMVSGPGKTPDCFE